MVLFIQVSGLTVCEMVKGLSFGQMDLDTKDSGEMTKLIDLVNLYMQTVIFMKVNGLTIRLKVKEHIIMQMEHIMKVTGLMTNNMDWGLKAGRMELVMKVIT
jgi:hypothetical protein